MKNLDPALLATAPEVRWREIARMRDQLALHYFDTDHAIVEYIVHEELATLRIAVEALIEQASSGAASPRQEPPQGDDPASD
ncbi:MAG: HepT-like ribonuclease domain-containing protein [Acidimicrobiales bacterium]